jgi:Holliday junction resolvase-like predicted endonuclease
VSTFGGTVYFTEVRYRKVNSWGSGLETITPKKLNQMNFAANFWINNNHWEGPAIIQVASVCGNPYELESITEII